LEFNLFFCFFALVFKAQQIKEAFVANAIQLALEHRQIFIHHHATKTIEATIKYCTNMCIASSSYF
jgi:hypothetical protein